MIWQTDNPTYYYAPPWSDRRLTYTSSWPSCVCILCNNSSMKLSVHLSCCSADGLPPLNAAWMAAHCNSAPLIPFLLVWVMRVILVTSSCEIIRTTRSINYATRNSMTVHKLNRKLNLVYSIEVGCTLDCQGSSIWVVMVTENRAQLTPLCVVE